MSEILGFYSFGSSSLNNFNWQHCFERTIINAVFSAKFVVISLHLQYYLQLSHIEQNVQTAYRNSLLSKRYSIKIMFLNPL